MNSIGGVTPEVNHRTGQAWKYLKYSTGVYNPFITLAEKVLVYSEGGALLIDTVLKA